MFSVRHSSLAQLEAQERLLHFSLFPFSPSDTIASGDLDAACYRAAEKKKTGDPDSKELHWEQQTQIPQYEREASGSAIQEDETERI